MPNIFPNGMNYIQEAIGKPLILHNRYWAVNNNYSSNYEFISGPIEALPIDESFFPYLLGTAKGWNVVTYEQDWLVKQYSLMTQTQNNVYTSIRWLKQMGNAASNYGLTIQYCMPLPQFWLASSEIQSVTHSRVSDDYLHGKNQWNIGKTSMIVWALGIYPFKDVTWSTSIQYGNPYNLEEYNPEMEIIISVLTAGPVGFGDGIGYTNKSLIMSTCTNNGTILGASIPAIPIEKYFGNLPPDGEIWSSLSYINNNNNSEYKWAYIISISILNEYYIYPIDLKLNSNYEYYYWNYNDINLNNIDIISNNQPLKLESTPGGIVNGKQYFSFYRILPIFKENNWSFIGEIDKIISVSPIRVLNIDINNDGFTVSIKLMENELSIFGAISPNNNIIKIECEYPSSTIECLSNTNNCICL